jgi:hypothetical protein
MHISPVPSAKPNLNSPFPSLGPCHAVVTSHLNASQLVERQALPSSFYIIPPSTTVYPSFFYKTIVSPPISLLTIPRSTSTAIMKFSIITILSLASFVLAGVPARKQSKTPEYIPDAYIIQFKDTITMSAKGDNAHFKWLNEALAKENVKREAGAPKYGVKSKYQIPGFMGYSGTFSKSIVDEIKKRNEVSAIQFYIAHYPTPHLITLHYTITRLCRLTRALLTCLTQVVDVTQDAIVRTQAPSGLMNGVEKSALVTPGRPTAPDFPLSQRFPCTEQQLSTVEDDGMWGLGRISHMGAPPNTTESGWPKYVYDRYTGKCPKDSPPTAYVVDSGILSNHPDYIGRAENGFNYKPGVWPNEDVCGHGTHVAGIIGGTKHGVMKSTRLIGVKVLEGADAECSGTWSGVIAGVNWAIKDAKLKNALKTSVINMSLGKFSLKIKRQNQD